MKNFFITGTDTDAGKTVLTSLLIGAFKEIGLDVLPMKPAQTGCENNIPDLDYICNVGNIYKTSKLVELMAPACFQSPCSPHLAAEKEGKSISLDMLLDAFDSLKKIVPHVLVEGAGGLMVPLNRKETMLDLINKFNLPTVIAARPGLGTINHTLLTVQALKQSAIPVAGVVFIHSNQEAEDFTTHDNIKTIREFGGINFLGSIPYEPMLDTTNPPCFNTLPDKIKIESIKIVKKLLI